MRCDLADLAGMFGHGVHNIAVELWNIWTAAKTVVLELMRLRLFN